MDIVELEDLLKTDVDVDMQARRVQSMARWVPTSLRDKDDTVLFSEAFITRSGKDDLVMLAELIGRSPVSQSCVVLPTATCGFVNVSMNDPRDNTMHNLRVMTRRMFIGGSSFSGIQISTNAAGEREACRLIGVDYELMRSVLGDAEIEWNAAETAVFCDATGLPKECECDVHRTEVVEVCGKIYALVNHHDSSFNVAYMRFEDASPRVLTSYETHEEVKRSVLENVRGHFVQPVPDEWLRKAYQQKTNVSMREFMLGAPQ